MNIWESMLTALASLGLAGMVVSGVYLLALLGVAAEEYVPPHHHTLRAAMCFAPVAVALWVVLTLGFYLAGD